MRRLLLSTAMALRLVPAAAQGGVDRCAQLQDPRHLVEEGLRQYRAGFADQRPAVSRQRHEQALRCYERAIEHSLNPAKIYHPLGLVYEKLGRPEEALPPTSGSSPRYPRRSEARRSRARSRRGSLPCASSAWYASFPVRPCPRLRPRPKWTQW